MEVSIHASVKDATIKISAYPFRAYVSIHASVKDATVIKGDKRFYSFVSIHASVKDATFCHNHCKPFRGFNPRICKRCDSVVAAANTGAQSFNPRICKRCDCFEATQS